VGVEVGTDGMALTVASRAAATVSAIMVTSKTVSAVGAGTEAGDNPGTTHPKITSKEVRVMNDICSLERIMRFSPDNLRGRIL
jgi:hypothetical protein